MFLRGLKPSIAPNRFGRLGDLLLAEKDQLGTQLDGVLPSQGEGPKNYFMPAYGYPSSESIRKE